jgi:hypothetical protein
MVLGLCGIGLIAIAAFEVAQGRLVRAHIVAIFSAAGGGFGGTASIGIAKRRAGTIVASLGTGIRFRSAPVVFLSVGMIGVVMQFIDLIAEAYQPAATLALIGQTLFFLGFAVWMTLMARTPWAFGERGILGPNVFVPWPQVVDYQWQDPTTLAITTTTVRRRLTIPVAPETHERADSILASKLAER